MQSTPIWQLGKSESGITDSERYLGVLARKAFLSFWSFQNPFTDESGGRELCDLLVVFGNDVIIFSDKYCNFPNAHTVKVAWPRWFKSAIEKSAKQLAGARSFIEQYPSRVFLDPACKHPLPVPLPSKENLRLHLVAVTRGSVSAGERYWGNGSSGSLIINTMLHAEDHKTNPFMVGWPLKKRLFIHVLDELTLDVLLGELDTAPDLIEYLRKKEDYLCRPGVDFLVCGEEELLATYLLNKNNDALTGFSFPVAPDDKKLLMFEEGRWSRFRASDAYSEWKKRIANSYLWDELIEHQTRHIQNSTAQVFKWSKNTSCDVHAHEEVLRAMAQEGRIGRMKLSEQLKDVLTRSFAEDRFSKIVVLPSRPGRAYVLMVLRRDRSANEADYRELRKASLVGYCRAARLRVSGVHEVVGIATEQLDFHQTTQDFTLMQFTSPLSKEGKREELAVLRRLGIWKDHWTCAC
ncbi:hypothetical protein [Corticimicrobacter populi]|uniref:Uncharacterized protein n=1 Tax=Corticimicrobacter populi TaxID=2175229 RepID=A0A2V1JZM3_9BURK|nr:hypothetical protein [Corticimicrobacter populi]PWF22939.1 hypothetical protein DD235_07955 [Corticimicrobacter populi]